MKTENLRKLHTGATHSMMSFGGMPDLELRRPEYGIAVPITTPRSDASRVRTTMRY